MEVLALKMLAKLLLIGKCAFMEPSHFHDPTVLPLKNLAEKDPESPYILKVEKHN